MLHLLYTVLLGLGFVLAVPYYAWKGGGRHLRSFRARLGQGLPPAPGRPSVWVHAVSVGEVLAARILIGPLKARLPGHAVFVSTTTLTGQAVARTALRGIDGLFYAPFDFPGPVRRVLSALHPSLLVLVETELWPNLIHQSRRHGCRVAVVNGRLSPRSFARYRRVRPLLRHVLEEVDLFLMQSEPHAERARAIGAPAGSVRVVGNLKFDAPVATPSAGLAAALGAEGGAPLWVVGSTVAGEEEQVLQAFARVRAEVPGLRLLVAPRHPERFGLVPPLVEAAGFACARRSTLGPEGWGGGDVLVLDTLGELAHVYGLATVVFVWGSLQPVGGHNVLEPAAAGRAVVVGPHMENFQEIADEFLAADALVQVADAEGLARAVLELLSDVPRREAIGGRARALLEGNRGAVNRTVAALAELAVPGPQGGPAA